MPVVLRNVDVCKLVWKAPALSQRHADLQQPALCGRLCLRKTCQRTRIVDGRARKATGVRKPRDEWSVLLRDNHEGYISCGSMRRTISFWPENAHMKKNCDRKSARGGRALLTGLMPMRRCGRMMASSTQRQRQRASLPVPRRRCSCGCRPLYPVLAASGSMRRCDPDSGSGVRSRRRSGDLRLGSSASGPEEMSLRQSSGTSKAHATKRCWPVEV